MDPVTSLTEYIDYVCEPEEYYAMDRSDDPYEMARSNEIIKMLTAWKDKETSETLDEFFRTNYRYIYSYKHRRECSPKLESSKRNRYELFYRGVNNSNYKIAPGIYRGLERHDESFYYHEMSVRCPEVFRNSSNLEKLTYMQHYGCPTRLLDITSNPLVALYFACCGASEDINGAVYVFAVPIEEVLYENSDRILILSHLAEYRKGQQEEMWRLAYRHILQDKFKQTSSGKYQDRIIEQFFHSIKRHNGAFEREIIPYDMLKPLFVKPNKDNPRILKQDGAFIACGLSLDERECDMKIRKCLLHEIAIDAHSKKRILNALERIGINEATLFPEVDKIANYLRNSRI